MKSNKLNIEVCLTPALLDAYHSQPGTHVVLVDVLRATTTICTAFRYGAEALIPVATLEEALAYKGKGYLVAAERDGVKPGFADFGNSAFQFMTEAIRGKTIVYSTTNGTQAFERIKKGIVVAAGAFVNISALAGWLQNQGRPVLILCSGWKGRFNLEDTVFAGALACRLLESGLFSTQSDAAHAAMDLWNMAKNDLTGYHHKAEHHDRLVRLGLDDVIGYTFAPDSCPVVPVAIDGIFRSAAFPAE